MRSINRAVAVAAAAVLGASSARAFDMSRLTQYKKPNMHYGQLALHPLYRLSEAYDSNIYLVPRDQPVSVGGGVKGSWITKNELALEAVLPWRTLHAFSAGYDVAAHTYATQPQLNDTINQRAHADYVFSARPYGLTCKIGDQYENTTDQAFSELIARNRRWLNTLYASLDYDLENSYLTGGVDASHATNKYLGAAVGRQLNRYEQRAGFNVGWKIQPKTKLYASYHRGVMHYTVHRELPDEDKNSKSHDLGIGVSGVLGPRLTGQVEGGVTFREYDEQPIGGAARATRNVTAATSVVFRASRSTDFTLAVSRRLQESTSASNRFYISNSVSLDARHAFARKFTAGANAAFSVDKYPQAQAVAGGGTGSRRDDTYQGGVWLEYEIQAWLSTGLAYSLRDRASTIPGQFNYRDQQTSWNLALKF